MKSKAIFFGAMLVSAVILSHPALATTVDLTAEVNANLSSYTNGTVYPANGGPITIGGVGFNLNAFPNGGTGVIQTDASSTTPFVIPVGQFGVTTRRRCQAGLAACGRPYPAHNSFATECLARGSAAAVDPAS
jgi:hypothetical protein